MKYAIIITITLLIGSCSMFGINSEKEIPFQIVEKNDGIEIRKYNNLTLASVKGTTRNKSFRKLFNYISGENVKEQKIKMTTPVIMDSNEEQDRMSFVLPSSFSYETTPKPNNSEVVIQNYNDKKFAVITHKGGISDDEIEKLKVKIKNYVVTKGYKKQDEVFNFKLASFNPPWTIPMFRKYEVMLEL